MQISHIINLTSNMTVSTFNSMVKLAILAAVCLVGGMAMVLDKPYYDLESAEDLFQDFVQEHGKSYSRKEYYERLEIFKKSLKRINRLNTESSGTVFAVNHFADLKPEELEQYRGLRPSNEKGVDVVVDSSLVLPPSHDWRDHDAVTPVMKQGTKCASCYIFSAMGNIEGQHALKHKECLALSKQQVLDCLDCGSCGGGYMDEVLQEFANRSIGPMLEKDYPYVAEEQKNCQEDAKKVVVHVTNGQKLNIPDEDTLQQKLYEIGPLAVGIVSTRSMIDYKSGIFDTVDDCATAKVNHGVLLVGYGEENGKKFWIIKNSWGEDWGEKGYIRLIRGVNACKMGTGYTASATVA